jgi:hypothetical protein
MSNLNRNAVIDVKAYVEPFVRREDGFTLMAPFHPNHPMRMMDTIKVGSMQEMWSLAPLGIEIPEQNEDNNALAYVFSGINLPKPVLMIRAEDYGGSPIYKIASTTTLPDDIALVEGALDVAKGLVWRRVDAIEALFWFVLFDGVSVRLNLPNPVTSFRELFALARASLSRMTPYFHFDVLLRPIAYWAALLENANALSGVFSYTEPQFASGQMTLIPIAADYRFLAYEPVVVYPRSVISLCKRYIYETEFAERVVDEASERNVIRITCERYLVPILPFIFYYRTGGQFTIPSVSIDAQYAIREIASVYGIGAFFNIEYAAMVG